MAIGAALGALVARRSFRRTGDADRRWDIVTAWGTLGGALALVWILVMAVGVA